MRHTEKRKDSSGSQALAWGRSLRATVCCCSAMSNDGCQTHGYLADVGIGNALALQLGMHAVQVLRPT